MGDIVVYGPNPVECLRKASSWTTVIAGDWDRAVADHDPTQWCLELNRQIERIQKQISGEHDSDLLLATVNSFLNRHEQLGCEFCHGTPSDDREFVFPEDIYCQKKMNRIANDFNHTLFAGHTHLPGLFVKTTGSEWSFTEVPPGQKYKISDYERLICNVGSVGQPRDGDPKPSFVLFDGKEIEFHRIDYDIETTISKVKNDPDNDHTQGDRLPEGR